MLRAECTEKESSSSTFSVQRCHIVLMDTVNCKMISSEISLHLQQKEKKRKIQLEISLMIYSHQQRNKKNHKKKEKNHKKKEKNQEKKVKAKPKPSPRIPSEISLMIYLPQPKTMMQPQAKKSN